MEHDGLTGQLLVVVLGEGDVDVLLLAGAHADDLLLKTGNELAGTQLQVKVVALAALEGYAIIEALEVDVGGVAHLGGTLHGLGGSDILRHPIQLGLHLLVGDVNLLLLHFQTLVLAQSDLGVHLSGQGQGDDVVVADLHVGQVGTADGLEILLGNGEVIDLGENLFQTVFVENVGAIHGLDHLSGSLALTEAGELDALAGLHVSLVDTGLHQFLVDFDNDGSLVAFSFDALNVHCK